MHPADAAVAVHDAVFPGERLAGGQRPLQRHVGDREIIGVDDADEAAHLVMDEIAGGIAGDFGDRVADELHRMAAAGAAAVAGAGHVGEQGAELRVAGGQGEAVGFAAGDLMGDVPEHRQDDGDQRQRHHGVALNVIPPGRQCVAAADADGDDQRPAADGAVADHALDTVGRQEDQAFAFAPALDHRQPGFDIGGAIGFRTAGGRSRQGGAVAAQQGDKAVGAKIRIAIQRREVIGIDLRHGGAGHLAIGAAQDAADGENPFAVGGIARRQAEQHAAAVGSRVRQQDRRHSGRFGAAGILQDPAIAPTPG